jgi:hypothetical protein
MVSVANLRVKARQAELIVIPPEPYRHTQSYPVTWLGHSGYVWKIRSGIIGIGGGTRPDDPIAPGGSAAGRGLSFLCRGDTAPSHILSGYRWLRFSGNG